MAKWISLNEAASKYGVPPDDIRAWAESGCIPRSVIGGVFTVDEECVREYLRLESSSVPGTQFYALKRLYENQLSIGKLYLEIIHVQQQRMKEQAEQNSRLEELLELVEAQNKDLSEYIESIGMASCASPFQHFRDWWAKLCEKLR